MRQLKCLWIHTEQSVYDVSPSRACLLCHPLSVTPFDERRLFGIDEEETLCKARVHKRISSKCLAEERRLNATYDAHCRIVNKSGFFRFPVDGEADVGLNGQQLRYFAP